MKLDLDALFPKRVEHMKEVDAAGGFCGKQNDGYGCTQPKGHEGKHVAHSTLMAVLHTWEE